MTKGPDPLGMKMLVIPPVKLPRPAEMLAESGENAEWVVEKSNYKYQLSDVTVYRNEDYNCPEYFCLILLRIHLCIYTHTLNRYSYFSFLYVFTI